jgi:DNA repair photolyase
MAETEKRVITDDEIEKDIAELREAAAWHNDREKLEKEEAVCARIREKYRRNPAARKKLYARLPEKARFSKQATIGDIEEFKKPEIRANLPD